VRCQSGLPAVGEVLKPLSFPHTVAGCMRGSHHAPLMPVGVDQAHPSRFDGPPRVVALGFQLKEGRLIGLRDLFADPAFDRDLPRNPSGTSVGAIRIRRLGGCLQSGWPGLPQAWPSLLPNRDVRPVG